MSHQSHRAVRTLVVTGFLFLSVGALRATVLDLGSSGSGTVGGALFSTTAIQPTGTGVFGPFMTLQGGSTEQGYNSSTGNFDTKRESQWNHEIKVSDLQVTMVNNIAYYGFVVDINQPNGGSKSIISLDALKIFTSSALQNNTSTDANGRFNGSLGNLVYDFGNNQVIYDDQQHGSGSGDLNILVPVDLFKGANPDDYVYVYQAWGGTSGGFEETAIRPGTPVVPEVPTAWPVFAFLGLLAFSRVLRRKRAHTA